MYKRYAKKIKLFSFLVMSLFMFASVVFAVASISNYRFTEKGQMIEVEADSKMSGYVYLQAGRRYEQYYNGQFRFILYKKGLLGYSKQGNSHVLNTYNNLNIVEYWPDRSTGNYKGTLDLWVADTTGDYSGITTSFKIDQN